MSVSTVNVHGCPTCCAATVVSPTSLLRIDIRKYGIALIVYVPAGSEK